MLDLIMFNCIFIQMKFYELDLDLVSRLNFELPPFGSIVVPDTD